MSHVAEQLELIQSRAKKNGKEAKRVFKQNKIIKKDLDEFKAHIHRHVSDVIKEITDDIEYKDAFMRVQNKQLESYIAHRRERRKFERQI